MPTDPLQRKLNSLARLSREINAEIKARWPGGFLFAEAGGGLHIMDGDADGLSVDTSERQIHIVLTASGLHEIGVGAW